jgi:L-threonylcarbamoyladenylate synthase
MEHLTIPADAIAPDALARAAERLRAGGLVAFPTETVYGLGAHAMDAAAVARIYATKGRPAHNPVIVHVADEAAARAITASWPPMAAQLAARWWPGPLTLVLPRAAGVPDIVTAGLSKVGVRVPAHPVALALLRAAGLPIAAPSANRSDAVSPTTAEHVRASLGEAADVLLLDGGPCTVGIESTVLDVSGDAPVLLRPGGIARSAIERELGVAVRHAGEVARDDAPRASPGQLAKHYAPRARVVLVDSGEPSSLRVAIDEARARHGDAVGVLALTAPPLDVGGIAVETMPADPDAYARRLYAALHAMDERGVAVLLVERVPDGDAWDGVRDRLARAAA